MIHVTYSDGQQEQYGSVAEAEQGIAETVLGCDFAITVDDVQVDDGPDLACEWSINLVEN